MQVQDPALTLAINQVTLAAQALALVEDMLFFEGIDAQLPAEGIQSVDLPAGDKEKLQYGLLGIAGPNKTIDVQPARQAPRIYGLETFNAVVEGLAYFTLSLQGPPYALILAPDIFADINLPLATNALVTSRRCYTSPSRFWPVGDVGRDAPEHGTASVSGRENNDPFRRNRPVGGIQFIR